MAQIRRTLNLLNDATTISECVQCFDILAVKSFDVKDKDTKIHILKSILRHFIHTFECCRVKAIDIILSFVKSSFLDLPNTVIYAIPVILYCLELPHQEESEEVRLLLLHLVTAMIDSIKLSNKNLNKTSYATLK